MDYALAQTFHAHPFRSAPLEHGDIEGQAVVIIRIAFPVTGKKRRQHMADFNAGAHGALGIGLPDNALFHRNTGKSPVMESKHGTASIINWVSENMR